MKKKNRKVSDNYQYHNCRWCNKTKREDEFFKCSVRHNNFICMDCIKKKYNELNKRCEKYQAIFICCAILDIAFYFDIYQSLKTGEGIGYYIRQLNLIQNQNPDSFEEGIIKHDILNYEPDDMKIKKSKEELTRIIKDLQNIKNDL